MATNNYYSILGVPETATDDEIKKAYRKIAMKYHPDKNPGDKEAEVKFKEASEAYDVLSNPEKKKNYDTFGSAEGRPFGFNESGFSSGFNPFGPEWSYDLNGFRFSGFNKSPEPSSIRVNIQVSFAKSILGGDVEFSYDRFEKCPDCQGSGASKDGKKTVCPDCQGSGFIDKSYNGFMRTRFTCPKCSGKGTSIDKPCKTCKGSGLIKKQKTISFKVPSLVEPGTKFVLKGLGNESESGSTAGNLIIIINCPTADNIFERHNTNDIFCCASISYVDAMLGCDLDINWLDGRVLTTHIPAGVQTGELIRLPKIVDNADLYVEVHIKVSGKLSEKEKDLVQELKKIDTLGKPVIEKRA